MYIALLFYLSKLGNAVLNQSVSAMFNLLATTWMVGAVVTGKVPDKSKVHLKDREDSF